MILVTNYYIPNNPKREMEINKCLILNYIQPNIEEIYLLNDRLYDLSFLPPHQTKVQQFCIVPENAKLSFPLAIDFINTYLKDKHVILSNSDIYFDETLNHIKQFEANEMYALLRYEKGVLYSDDFQIPRMNSQDCWMFRSPLQVPHETISFTLGQLGCDNIFAYQLYKHGYVIKNPCYTVHTHHLHESQYRTYNEDDRMHGMYMNIKPATIEDVSEYEIYEY
jgi:hypothetical protein